MDAIVTAGGIPQPDDPLYLYSKGESKALLDVAGKPMIQWVLDALSGAKNVDNVIVIGLTPKSGVTCKKPLYFLANEGRMLANIVAGVNKVREVNGNAQYALIVSSDIPAVTSKQIDWLIKTCMETKDDLYYGVCPREVMEARFPESKRTYTKLKDMQVCGADMNIAHVRLAREHLDVWEALIANRKNPAAQAKVMGLGTLFLLLTRQATLADFVERVSKRIGIKGRAIVWQGAEPCMDVDKPHQLEMMRADLVKRSRAASPKKAKRPAPKKKVVKTSNTKRKAKKK
ncbi:MAG: nucleotidyltransferase family protein [Chloroflexi bacterium]|nr:nucleotidyltransferase family protein [Chloroflexota bacterium]